MMLKLAVLQPMPTARVKTAVIVNPGDLAADGTRT
jgi:hypothetical protein